MAPHPHQLSHVERDVSKPYTPHNFAFKPLDGGGMPLHLSSYHSNPETQMENSGFVMDKSLEMTGVTTISEKITDSHQTQPERGADLDRPNHCNVAVCRNLHEQYLKDKSKMSSSPWHQLKSVFLVGIIMLLVMWVLVYAVCTWLELV